MVGVTSKLRKPALEDRIAPGLTLNFPKSETICLSVYPPAAPHPGPRGLVSVDRQTQAVGSFSD